MTADARIPPEQVAEVNATTQQAIDAIRPILENCPQGEPAVAVLMLRWEHGASALVATPAHDPLLLLAAIWNGLQATVDSLGISMQEFLDTVMEADDADPR